jgi:hypothetical protein
VGIFNLVTKPRAVVVALIMVVPLIATAAIATGASRPSQSSVLTSVQFSAPEKVDAYGLRGIACPSAALCVGAIITSTDASARHPHWRASFNGPGTDF